MKSFLTPVFLLCTIFAFSQKEETGKSFLIALLKEKNVQNSYSYLDENAKAKINEKALEQTAAQLESQLGKFVDIIEINKEDQTYYYFSEFEKMKLDIKINFSDDNKIKGFVFVPHKEFNRPKLGADLNIKSKGIELHGTLLDPEINNIKKLVVFVHGSGPEDRDETIIENKPFRDIAEKLYQNGISSYRFDKRTLSNPESFHNESTIDDEVTYDILNIVNFFKQDKKFKEYQIIVMGHSLGAYLLPRIANKANHQIDKIILLAGSARPITELVTEQYDYLLKLNPTPELEKDAEKMKASIAALHSKNFSLKTPKEELPFNMSAYYWKSVLDYDALKEVRKLRIPILVLQGERDYQVGMTDFELWKNTLKNNTNASLKSYPKLNHLFMTGEQPSNPAEYAIKGNVDQAVVNDISQFIKKS